jgi:hypothetical protein
MAVGNDASIASRSGVVFLSGEARRYWGLLVRAVAAAAPLGSTGKVTVALNFHQGTLGRTVITREAVIPLDQ